MLHNTGIYVNWEMPIPNTTAMKLLLAGFFPLAVWQIRIHNHIAL